MKLRLEKKWGAIYWDADIRVFQYRRHFGVDYRIVVFVKGNRFIWEIHKNISSYGNKYEGVAFDEKDYKTVEAAKRSAYRTLKTLI